MYLMSKLSKPSIAFVNNMNATGGNRKQAFAIAIGYAMARELPMPAEPVEDIVAYYKLQFSFGVSDQMSRLNDCLVFDTKEARCMVEQFYTFRYRAMHPTTIPLALIEGQGLQDFFGMSAIFGKDTLATIASGTGELTGLVNNLTKVLAEMKDAVVQKPFEQEQDVYVA